MKTIITRTSNHLNMPTSSTSNYNVMNASSNFMKQFISKLLVGLLFVLGTLNVNGQASMANYAGANFNAASGTYTPLGSGTTVSALLVDDAISGALPIGFTFFYMGVPYTNVYASSNGFISFNSSATSTFTNSLSTTGTGNLPLLAPYWDDMSGANTTGGPSKAWYSTTGTAGSRVFTFEWLNWQRTGAASTTGAGLSFQVQLYEATGQIKFVYRNDATALTGTISASIGIVASTTGTGNYASVNGVTASATTSTSTETSITAKPASGITFSFNPASTNTPGALSFTNVGTTSYTVNWADNSTAEVGYALYYSTDGGTTYTYLGVTAANATSQAVTGMTPGTTYLWKVYPVRESLGTPSTGTQATNSCGGGYSGTYTVGPGGNWTSLSTAVNDIKQCGVSGPVILELNSTYTSTGDAFPITLAAFTGASATNTVTIRPASGVTGRTITSASTTATIDINAGNYWIIDGRAGGSGASQLTIANTSTATGGTAVRFINEGSNNRLQYLTLSALFPSTSSGVVNFSTTTGSNGNDNNTIDNCSIDCGAGSTASPTLTALNGIYSVGTTTTTATNNSGNTVSNCNIFNFFGAATASNGIQLGLGNTDWSITGNSFYQTATRTATTGTTQTAINISNSTSGNNFIVTGNFIGGDAASAAVSTQKYTISGAFANVFNGISLSVGTASVQNNTIRNINFQSNTSGNIFVAINITAGTVNVGTTTGNTIGSNTVSATSISASSIAIQQSSVNAGVVIGISSSSTGTIDIRNNNIGGVYMTAQAGTNTLGNTFYGIRLTAGTNTVYGNTIGSTTNANSINSDGNKNTTTNANTLAGISITGGTNTIGGTGAGQGNTIQNISYSASGGTGPSTAISVFGIQTTSTTNNTFTKNTIANLSSLSGNTGTGSSASVVGISMNNSSSNSTISQNTIYGLSNTHASAAVTVQGIMYNSSTGTNLIERNLIYGLDVANATGSITGIHVNGGTATYRNNMISLGATGSVSTVGATINGINETTAGTDNFYFNSVYIGGAPVATSANNTFAFQSSITTNARNYQNNIFWNARSNNGATGKHYAIRVGGTAANPSGLTSNYNILYANGTGGNVGLFNAVDQPTIAAWRTATGQDANSFSSDPQFQSATTATPDLHINPSIGTAVEANGLAIGTVTDDYDGQARASFSPTDIGADAGDFTSSGDIVAPSITHTAVTKSCATSTVALTATITDAGSGVPTTGTGLPVVYYNKNGGTYVSKQSTYSGSGGVYNFTLDYSLISGGVAIGDIIRYYIVAQDVTGNVAASPSAGAGSFTANPPAAGTVPTTPNQFTIGTSLSGTKTIGTAGDYGNLTTAIAAYNTGCLTGATTFSLVSGYPTSAETFPLTINANTDASATNTLTIKPAVSGLSISGSSATGLIVFNGADYVTLNGTTGSTANTVCPASAASRDLTITNTNTGTTSAVIWLQTTAGADAATNNSIINTNIVGNGNTQTLFGIGSGSATISTSSLGTSNNNNSYINNNISKTQYGIYTAGASSVTKNSGTTINQNLINTASPNNVAIGGIFAAFENNITISGNNIGNIVSAATNDIFGISAGYVVSGTTTTNFGTQEVSNATISNNIISNISQTATYSAVGIQLGQSASGTSSITNNAISVVNSNGTSGDFGAGIFAVSATGSTLNIYHNSVFMSGGTAATLTTTGGNYGLAIGGTGAGTATNVRNNIFANTTTTNMNGYAIGIAYSTFTNLTLSNNNYYKPASGNFVLARTGSLASGSNVTTVPVITGETGSITTDPLFNSTTNLVLQAGSGAFGTGITGVGVAQDILCVTRATGVSPSGPSMGAYETSSDAAAPTISYTALSSPTCTPGVRTLTATITDASGVGSGANLPVAYFKINSGAYTKVTGVNTTGSTYTFDIGTGTVAGDVVSYYVVAQDNYSTPNVGSFPAGATVSANPPTSSAPPATPSSYTVSQVLGSATYTVGSGGTFATLGAAAAAYNACPITGAPILSITSNLSESGAVIFNANTGASATNFLTIKPAASTTASITGTVASDGLIQFNGADYITIDGSNSGGTDRSLTITNLSTTSPTAISIESAGTGAGATNNVIKNLNISTGVSTATGYGVAVGGTTPGTTGADNDNVTIQNNNITVATVSIFAGGTASVTSGGDDNLTITGNTVNSNTTILNYGIRVSNALNSTISQNTVSVVTSAGDSPVGISLETGFVSSTVSRNLITSVVAGSGGYGGRGITIGTGTASSALTLSNNVIYGVNGTNYTSFTNSSSMGICIGTIGNSTTLSTTTGGVNLYFNSVNMTGSIGASGTARITTALYVGSGASALDIRNNIFSNTQVGTDVTQKNYAIYSAAAIGAFTTINYNDYYVSNSFNAASAIPGFLTSDRTTLGAIQTAFGGNTNSIIADPLFNSSTNLILQLGSPALGTGVAGTGVLIDYTGATRSTGTSPSGPSMGAYEVGLDITAPVITYSALGNGVSTSPRAFGSVTITDPGSGVNTTSGTRPRVYYKRSTDNNAILDNTSSTNGWKYVEANGTTSPFDFSIDYTLLNGGTGVTTGNTIQYFVVAQDLASTPNVAINSGTFNATPTSVALTGTAAPIGGTINSYNITASYSGTINVGSSETITSLTNAGGAFALINAGTVTGNITLNITSDLTAETGANALNEFASGFTMLIKPSAANRVISGTSATSLIRINGADLVTIDGSTSGGTDRNLTIINNNTGTSSGVIHIASASASNAATGNTVKNCIISGNATTTTQFGIFVGGTTMSTTGNALLQNNTTTITNNQISKIQYGIFYIGVSSAALSTGVTISNNNIGTSTSGDGYSAFGIFASLLSGGTISGNTVQNNQNSSTFGFAPVGSTVFNSGIYLQNSQNSSVSKNKVFDMNIAGSVTVIRVFAISAESPSFNTSGNPSNNTISNNIVYGIRYSGSASSTWQVSGINANGGYGDKFYYNSVYLSGSLTAGTSGPNAAFSNGNASTSTSTSNIDVRNNIFYINGTASTGTYYAHYFAGTTLSGSTINYNDVSTTITGGGTAYIGNINTTTYSTIATWRTALGTASATGAEVQSISADPLFLSTSSLLLSAGSPAIGTGFAVSILDDHLGTTRSTGTAPSGPTMGAYEGAAPSCAAPTNQATGITINMGTSGFGGSFTAAAAGATSASGYVVVRTSGSTPANLPVNGTTYAIGSGDQLGGTIISVGSSLNFSSTGLTPLGQYTVTVFAYNNNLCSGVAYNTTVTSSSNTSTFTLPSTATFTSVTSGLWNTASTWDKNAVPSSGDDVTIANGHTVTIDLPAAVAKSVTVGQGTSGILQYQATPAASLTVTNNVSVSAGASFTAGSGSLTTHTISLGGDLTNNGTLDLNTTAGVTATFTGAANQTVSGTGATTDLYGITLSKTALANTVELNLSNLTFRGTTSTTNGITLTSGTGTLKFSGSNTLTGNLGITGSYSVPATIGLWINNANFNYAQTTSGSPTFAGSLRISAGSFTMGTAVGNEMAMSGAFTLEGGTFNASGRFNGTGTFNMSGGALNVATVGASTATGANNNAFRFTGTTFTMSGGTIVLNQKCSSTGGDYVVTPSTSGNITGGRLQIGGASTTAASTFGISGITPTIYLNATNNPSVSQIADITAYGDIILNGSGSYNTNSKNLTITGNPSVPDAPGNIALFNTSVFTANGSPTAVITFNSPWATQYLYSPGNLGTITANQLPSLTINNANNVSIPSVSLLGGSTLNLTSGTLYVDNITFIQSGAATTTFVMNRTNGAISATTSSFGVANPTTTYTYNTSTSPVTTGPEIPTEVTTKPLTSLVINNTQGVTLDKPVVATGLTLSGGLLNTDATNLLTVNGTTITRTAGYVNGPLARVLPSGLTAGTTYSFPVGKSGYNPFDLIEPTTGAGSATLQVEVTEPATGTAGTDIVSLRGDRYWSALFTSGQSNFTSGKVRLYDVMANDGTEAIAQNTTDPNGAFDRINSTPNTTVSITSNSALSAPLGYFQIGTQSAAMEFISTTTVAASTLPVLKGATDQAVIGLKVVTANATAPLTVNNITFNNPYYANAGTDLTDAKVYYTGTTSTYNPASPGTLLGQLSSAPNSSSPMTISGSQNLVAGDNYFWLVYDINGTATINNKVDATIESVNIDGSTISLTPPGYTTPQDFIPTATAATGERSIKEVLNGDYTVGPNETGRNYLNLTDAIADLNYLGVNAPVRFLLQADYTSSTETFPIQINEAPGVGDYTTVTISPDNGVTTSITGSSSSAIFILNGADYILIDGTNSPQPNQVCPAITSTRDLTITNTYTGGTGNSAVIWLQNNGTNGATNNLIRNLNIVGANNGMTLAGIGSGGSTIALASAGKDNDNNSFNNNNIQKVRNGIISFGESALNKNTGTSITQNVMNQSVASGNNVRIAGILVGFEDGVTISGNTIDNIEPSATLVSPATAVTNTIDGIAISLGSQGVTTAGVTGSEVTNATVTNNIIGSVRQNNNRSAIGIAVSAVTTAGSVNTIANNMIYGVNSNGNTTNTDLTAGIYIGAASGSGTSTKVYHNTVSMSGTGFTVSTLNPSYCLALAGTNPPVEIRNNIFTNTSTNATSGTTTVNRAIGFASALASLSNVTSTNNDLYVSGTGAVVAQVAALVTSGATTYATTTAWNTASGKDANSKSVAPVFISATNLRLNTTNVSNLNNLNATGTPVSITNDIDCDTRNVSTPDMGADEYTPSTVNDAAVTAISVSSTLCPGSNPVTFSVINNGTTTITDLKVNWSVSTNGGAYAAQTQAVVTGLSIAPGGTATGLSLGNFTFAAGTTYLIKALPVVVNDPSVDDIQSDEFTSSSITTGLSGTYTVGASGNYTTLALAVADYNSKNICGNVVFSLIDASYSLGTTALSINSNASAVSGDYSLTIKPASGVNATISGAVASAALIRLNSAYKVTIDGNNGSGPATERNLTITNTSTTSPTAVSIVTNSISNTVMNCNISTGLSAATGYGIAVGGATPGTAGADNDNVIIQNNNITVATVGIYVSGSVAATSGSTTAADNISVTRNRITSTTSAIANIGIQVANAKGTISQDTLAVQSSVGGSPVGISLEGGFTNSTVSKNVITNVSTTSTSGYGGRGITIGTGTATSALNIVNNFISGVNGSNYSAFSNSSSMGIAIGTVGGSSTITTTAGGINLYHNTVSLTGNYSYAASTNTAALYVGSGASALDIRNNIFRNALNNTSSLYVSSSRNYAVYSAATKTAFTTMDYNDYYTDNATNAAQASILANISYSASQTDVATLTAIQNTTTGFGGNTNSKNVAPVFTSASDLHLVLASNYALNSVGANLSSVVSDDIDGDSRTSTPDLGADEINPPTLSDAQLTNLVATSAICPGSPASFQVTITNLGSEVLNTLTITTTATGLTPNVVNLTGLNIAVGASATASVGSFTFSSATTYNLTATSSVPNGNSDGVPGNDATSLNGVTVGLAAGTYTVGSGGDYSTLTAAVADYNSKGVCGPVVFNLISNIGVGETFPIIINAIPGSSSSNTLTIKPSAASRTISGSSATGIIAIVGGDYIRLDGSSNGTTSQDLTISNSNTGTSSYVVGLLSSTTGLGATNNIIKNLVISGNAPTTTAWGIVAQSTTSPNTGNTYQNNTISTAQIGIGVTGPADLSETGTVITGNTIGSTVAGNKIGYTGIEIFDQTGAVISQNIIAGLTTSNTSFTSIDGIYVGNGINGATISRNMISDVKHTSSSGYGANGIYLASTSTAANITVSNNVIYDIAGYGSALWGAIENGHGISMTSGGGYNIHFNSINLNTNQTSTSGYSAGIYVGSGCTTASSIVISNNIIAVTQTTGSLRYCVYSGAAASVFTGMNYNDYYRIAGTSGSSALGNIGGNDRTTIATMQAGFGGNTNSILDNPLFTSATNLKLSTGSPAYQTGATVAGITVDYLGTTRSATPSMGAYETAGDFVAPVITYTPATSPSCSATLALTITVDDATTGNSGVPTSGANVPILYWKLSASASYTAAPTTWTSGTTYTVSVNTGSTGGNVLYYVAAQDNVGNVAVSPSTGAAGLTANPPAAGTAPTSPNTLSVNYILGGTYTVGGAGSNFASLTAAVAAYNNACSISAPVVFSLTSSTYSVAATSETFPITVNANSFASAGDYSLTIRPASGVNATITGSQAGALIRLNGAYKVTIDGSNNGTTTRNLTITNTSTTTPTVVSIITNSVSNTVKNCNISTAGSSSSIGYGIAVGGATPGTGGADNDNTTIQNNSISVATIGIYASGTVAATSGTTVGAADNLTITGNTVSSENSSAANIGIQVLNGKGTISQNTIAVQSSVSGSPVGIAIQTGFTNSTVNANRITKVTTTSTAGWSGRGITISTGTASSALTVSNNMVYGISGSDYSAFHNSSSMGIGIGVIGTGSATTDLQGTAGGINLYNNSVSMTATISTSGSTTSITTALYIGSGASALDIRNNIFSNTMTGTASGQKNYAIYSAAANTAFTTINYNDYFVSNSFNAGSAILGNIGGNDFSTITTLRTAFTQNVNSFVLNPAFLSATDLHIACGTALNVGTPIGAVTTDYDGETRNATTPFVGADEIPVITGNTSGSSVSICNNSTTTLTGGTVTGLIGNTPTYLWESSANGTTGWAAAVGTNNTANYTTATLTTSSTQVYFRRTVTAGACSNSATAVLVTVNPVIAGNTSGSSVAICNNSSTTLTGGTVTGGSGSYTYLWESSANGTSGWTTATGTSNAANYTTATLTTSSTQVYFRRTVTSGGCTDVASAVQVTVNPSTVITTDAAPLAQTNQIGAAPDNLTVTATGTGTLTYQWKISSSSSTPVFSSNATGTGSTTASYSPPTSNVSGTTTYYYCTVSSDCGSVDSRVVTVSFTNSNVWKEGNSTNDWNTASNWTLNAVPTGSTNAAIPFNHTPYPVMSANSAVQDLIVDAGTTIGLNGKTFTINGAVTGSGTLSGSTTSSLVMGSAATGTLYFTSGANTLKNLTINGNTITLGNALNIAAGVSGPSQQAGVVTLASGATLVSGGKLTLKSNQYGTARIAQLPVNGSGVALATVTGNVTIERYISDNGGFRAWRLLSVPTKGSQTFKQAWQEGQAAMANGVPGYGTILTSTYGTWAANGYDAQTTAGNLLLYNNSTSAYSEVTSTNNAMQTTGGYYVYIRGDRSVSPSSSTTSATATTLRTTGTLYMGDQTALNIGANRYALVGNIYPSSVDFTQLEKSTGLQNAFYIWDPKVMTGTSQTGTSLGGYNTFSATNFWEPTAPTGSYPSGQSNTLIESGQAFFVYNPSTTTTNTIRFKEAAKATGNNYGVFRPANITRLKTYLYGMAKNGSTPMILDGNAVVFDNNYSVDVDANDAVKMTNTGANIGIVRSNQVLSVEGRPELKNSDTVYFDMANMKQQQYQFEFTGQNLDKPGMTAYLEDSYLNTKTPVNLNATTTATFTVDANPASSAKNRFRIVFSKAKLPSLNISKSGIAITPNPVEGSVVRIQLNNLPAGSYNVRILNNSGQVLLTSVLSHAGGNALQSVNLPQVIGRGAYQLELISTDRANRFTEKLFINRND